jgi:hypothetical protein
MKKLIAIAILSCTLSASMAQANKSVFFEVGGNGLGFSANFDSRFTKSEKGFGFRAGVGFIPPIDAIIFATPFILTVPLAINHLAGNGANYFESGIGVTYVHSSKGVAFFDDELDDAAISTIAIVPSIAYRHAKTGKAAQWRAVISPLLVDGTVAFWAGISIGYKF